MWPAPFLLLNQIFVINSNLELSLSWFSAEFLHCEVPNEQKE